MKKIRFTVLIFAVLLCLPLFIGCGEEPPLTVAQRIDLVAQEGVHVFDSRSSTKTEQEHIEALSLRAEEICTEKYSDRNYSSYYIKIFYNIVSEKPQFFQIEYDSESLVTGIIENDEYYEIKWEERSSVVKNSTLKDEKLYIMLNAGFIVLSVEKGDNNSSYFEIVYKKEDKLCTLDGSEISDSWSDYMYECSDRTILAKGYGIRENIITLLYIYNPNELNIHKRSGEDAYYRFFIPEYNSNYTEQEHVERINLIANEKLIEISYNESSYLSCDTQILYSPDEKPMYFMVTYRTDGSTLGGVKIPEKYDVGIIIDDVYYLIMETDENDKTMQFTERPDKIYYSAVNVFAQKKDGQFVEISGSKKGLGGGAYSWSFEQNFFAVKDKPNPTVTDAFDLYEP